MRFKITQAVPGPFFSGIDTSVGAFETVAEVGVTEAAGETGRAGVDGGETELNGPGLVGVAAAVVTGWPTGASTIARMTLSDTPDAFKLFSAAGAVSKLQAVDLILAIRTYAGSPAPDISEISLFVKE
jgi:hypothetical protein